MAEGGTPHDASVLRPAIQIGTRGIAQILKVYQAGTEEIRQLLTQECEVIFECKVCRSLFRGLPNLIAHKRAYCINEYVEQRKEFPNFYSSDVVTVMPDAPSNKSGSELSRLLVEPVPTVSVNQKTGKSISKTNLVPMLSPTGKSTWLKPKNNDVQPSEEQTKASDAGKEKCEGENEVDENYASVMKMVPARDRELLACSTCNKKFTTMKALLKHYNHLHLGEQTLYKCCLCPSVFTYQRSCRRHLERKHKKVPAEIAKLMKMILRKATKITRKIDASGSPPQKEEKPVSKTKFTNTGVVEVAGTEAKSNSNPVESAALTAPVVTNPADAPVKETEDFSAAKERLTCPDCGKEFEKRSILDRHMKVCADYAKIAVTFDMSLVKGMQHLATNYSSLGQDKSSASDSEDTKTSPGKKNRRKAAPCRLPSNIVDSDVESVMSDKSSRCDGSDAMPKLQPVSPLTTERLDTISRPSGQKSDNADGSLAKQTKLSNIETVLQFLKNPKKQSLMTIVGSEDDSVASKEKDMLPPTLEREDVSIEQETELQNVEMKVNKLQHDSHSDEQDSMTGDRAKLAGVSKKESHVVKTSKTALPLIIQRSWSASESRTTRTTSLRLFDSVTGDKKVSPRAVMKSDDMAPDTRETESSKVEFKSTPKTTVKENKEYQEPEFEVIDLENKNRPERAARKRERSEERTDLFLPAKVNRRAPRYASNFTTRRRQSMLEDILSGVGEESDQKSKTTNRERRNSEPSKEQSNDQTEIIAASVSGIAKSPAASPTARVVKRGEGEKPSPKKSANKTGEKSNESASSEVDSDEAGVLRCMLMDADTAPKGRRKGALLPSHIAQHVNYEDKVCNICNKNFTSISELISHISKTHMNMKRYRCSLCSVEGMYFSEITRHIARTHRRAFRANHKLEWLSMCVKPINISSGSD